MGLDNNSRLVAARSTTRWIFAATLYALAPPVGNDVYAVVEAARVLNPVALRRLGVEPFSVRSPSFTAYGLRFGNSAIRQSLPPIAST